MEDTPHDGQEYARRYSRGNLQMLTLANCILVTLALRFLPLVPDGLLRRDVITPADYVLLVAAASLFLYGREGSRRLRALSEALRLGTGPQGLDAMETLLMVRTRVIVVAGILWGIGLLGWFPRNPDLFLSASAASLALLILLHTDSTAVVFKIEYETDESAVVYRRGGGADSLEVGDSNHG